MLEDMRTAPRGRRFTLYSIALPIVAIGFWLAGYIPPHTLFPVVLGLATIGTMAAALLHQAPRMDEDAARQSLADRPTPRRTRVLIVGAGTSARRAALELESSGEHEIVGFVADEAPPALGMPLLLGGTQDISMLVRRLEVQQVIVAEAPAWQQQLAGMLTAETHSPIGVHVVPGLYEARVGRLQFHRVRDLPLVDLAPALPSPTYHAAKRCLDIAGSLLGLVVTAPAVVLAAVVIKLTSPGPILFSQERVGKSGRFFMIYKLRTMVADAERSTGPVLSAGAADARITSVGRLMRATRLDELPQLLNVLRGEMSLVGPRPERPVFAGRYAEEIVGYRERHQVLPGITGLAQVNAGYAVDAETKLRYDLLYVYNRSLWLDMKIMLQTLATVCRRTGQ